MKLHRFCSKCGKSFEDDKEICDGFLCQQCYGSIELEIPIPKITFYRCKLCNAYSISKEDQQSEWFFQKTNETELDFLTRILYEKIFIAMEKKLKLTFELFLNRDLNLTLYNEIPLIIQAKSADTLHSFKKDWKIHFKQQVCVNCAKKLGNRFDAILQIRIQSDKDQDRLEEMPNLCNQISDQEQMKDARNFIAKFEKVTNGFDLKLSTNMFLKSLSNRLQKLYNFQIKRSAHLVGVDPENGSDLYRQTLLLKLLPVRKDDRILMENIEYIVHKIANQKVYLQNPTTKQIIPANFSVFEKKQFLILSR